MNPSFASAYTSLARVMAERGAPLAEALSLAVQASRLEPGEIEHTLTALRLAARGGALEQARVRAEELLARVEGQDRRKVEALVVELSMARRPPPGGIDIEKACEAGETASCAPFARALERGRGVSSNPEKAARLFEGLCATGDNDACARLGSMLRQGRGVARDERRAQTLLTNACDRGSAFGCGELGALLAEGGQGVPVDAARARALLRKACDGGSTEACAGAASQ